MMMKYLIFKSNNVPKRCVFVSHPLAKQINMFAYRLNIHYKFCSTNKQLPCGPEIMDVYMFACNRLFLVYAPFCCMLSVTVGECCSLRFFEQIKMFREPQPNIVLSKVQVFVVNISTYGPVAVLGSYQDSIYASYIDNRINLLTLKKLCLLCPHLL